MTDKEKFRKEVKKLKSQLLRGACSSQVTMETRCKEEAYNEVLAILDTMQEEPVISNVNTESVGVPAGAVELANVPNREEPKDKCNGCNNVKGCITCVDGSEWAHYEYTDENKSITQADSYVKAHEDICDRKEHVSIWHDASEVPEKKKWILLVHKEGWYHVGRLYEGQRRNLVIFDGVSTFELNMFNKWVYVDDI